jgi:hypothetical protein
VEQHKTISPEEKIQRNRVRRTEGIP